MKIASTLLGLLLFAAPLAAQGFSEGFVRELRCPGGGRLPDAALDRDGALHLVYFAGAKAAGDLFYVHSEDEGATFSEPVRINEEPGTVRGTGALTGGSIDVDGRRQAHVVWLTAGKEPTIRYARVKSGEVSLRQQLAEGHRGLDVAPEIVYGQGRAVVLWHSLAESKAEASEDEPSRRLFLCDSEDFGETFSEPRMIDDERFGVSAGCTVSAVFAKRGTLYALYRTRNGKDRHLRFVSTDDFGVNVESRFLDSLLSRKAQRTSTALSLGPSTPVVAWINDDRLAWSSMNKSGAIGPPVGPRRKELWRRSPAIAASTKRAVMLTWLEGKEKGKPKRIGWQAFDLMNKNNIDLGSFEGDLSMDTTPLVFVRPSDEGFTILY